MVKILAFVALLLVAFWLVLPQTNQQAQLSKPWQIELNQNNNSSVLGIVLNETELYQAIKLFKDKAQYAYVKTAQGNLKFEVYYPTVRISGLTGKLLLVATTNKLPATLQNKEKLASDGSKMYATSSIPTDSIVKAITFIPSKDLSARVIIQRFGNPEKIIELTSELQHYLYPKLGVDIAISTQGYEIIQYVSPKNFEQLTKPLIEHINNQ